MSKRDYWLYISDIKDSIDRIVEYTVGKNYEDLISNSMLLDAIVRNFTIIGEASRHIPNNVRQKYNQIEWIKLSNLRNVIIHEYFSVDTEVLWEIIQDKIPDLSKKHRISVEG